MPFAFRAALRTIRRRPGDAAINVAGLALGLACCALIALHLSAELGADRQHPDGERVVRIVTDIADASGEETKTPTVPGPILNTVRDDAAVEAFAPVHTTGLRVRRPDGIEAPEALLVGPGFLDVLGGYALASGDAATALAQPQSVVLTEEAAVRLTGRADAVGEVLDLGEGRSLTVTGVLGPMGRSHLAFDALVARPADEAFEEWGNFDLTLYARLAPEADRESFGSRLQAALDAGIGGAMAQEGMQVTALAQPLREVYHAEDGRLLMPVHRSGQPGLLRVLGFVGLFVLAVAAVNFVNLATARSGERAREVGVRKAVGAGRGGLVRQFLLESVALAVASGVIAFVIVVLAIPLYNGLTGADLALAEVFAPEPLAIGLAVVVVVGLLAGAYPAAVLAAFQPSRTLRGQFASGREGTRLRKGLVVFQFAVSMTLLVATLVVGSQLRFMQEQDPGFEREHVLLVSALNVGGEDEARLKDAVLRLPGVEHASLTGAAPTQEGWQGQVVTALSGGGQTQTMETVVADADYAETFGLRVVAGRDLDAEIASDAQTAVLFNEAAARSLGWTPEEAVGQTIQTSGRDAGKVVGVLSNYAHHGFAQATAPQVYFELPGTALDLAVRVAPGADVREALQRVWEARVAEYPFEATALDAAVRAQYEGERRLARAFALFAGLAVVVAALGLFGLAAYAVQQRTKEVGVRKVLGATVAQLVARLSADFARPVAMGVLLASPLAWWALSRWLDGFATRVAITPLPFALAGLGAVAVAVVTVSLHTLRAAMADPVRALRSE